MFRRISESLAVFNRSFAADFKHFKIQEALLFHGSRPCYASCVAKACSERFKLEIEPTFQDRLLHLHDQRMDRPSRRRDRPLDPSLAPPATAVDCRPVRHPSTTGLSANKLDARETVPQFHSPKAPILLTCPSKARTKARWHSTSCWVCRSPCAKHKVEHGVLACAAVST